MKKLWAPAQKRKEGNQVLGELKLSNGGQSGRMSERRKARKEKRHRVPQQVSEGYKKKKKSAHDCEGFRHACRLTRWGGVELTPLQNSFAPGDRAGTGLFPRERRAKGISNAENKI